jgi:hypothetical protein
MAVESARRYPIQVISIVQKHCASGRKEQAEQGDRYDLSATLP